MSAETTFRTVEDLAAAAGVPARTVRYYIAEGLLPAPFGRGRKTTYGEEHLLRLLLIRRLVEQRVPLAEVREQVSGMRLDEVRAVLAEEQRRVAALDRARAERSPAEYIAALLQRSSFRSTGPRQPPEALVPPSPTELSAPTPMTGPPPAMAPLGEPPPPTASTSAAQEHWSRWELAPGVELHVRRDAPETSRRLVDHILRLLGRHLSGQ